MLSFIWILVALRAIDANIYLYYTEDGPSVEYYDCFFQSAFVYCRRPDAPIPLSRSPGTSRCLRGGRRHSFSDLRSRNVSANTIALEWRSTLEMAGQYAHYLKHYDTLRSTADGYVCQCDQTRRAFGKHCEYQLPTGISLSDTITYQTNTRKANVMAAQIQSDILCYTTLDCDPGLLCLDWRDICDGIQHCTLGYDEENCDLLEFHECERNEYRCMNGMCIPHEYFLDGEYDCMDLTDEIGGFDSKLCTWKQTSLECDERACPPSHWSCGDGQCIPDRLAFQKPLSVSPTCSSYRDQFFMCEIHHKARLWTMPNGKCSTDNDHVMETEMDECTYFIKCALSQGAEKNCPEYEPSHYSDGGDNPCSEQLLRYPNGAILGPYVTFLFYQSRDWRQRTPDLLYINASIKCRGYTVRYQSNDTYSEDFSLRAFEQKVCAMESDGLVLAEPGYDQRCHSDSLTFNNRSHDFLDVCENSQECISRHRLLDGHQNCLDGSDEQHSKWQSQACVNEQRYRFRCSSNGSNCLFVSSLGDLEVTCANRYDESWLGTDRALMKMNCAPSSKIDCSLIRQYVEGSWDASYESLLGGSAMRTIPFRAFCDTFWDLSSKTDEETALCQEWWVCLDDQWRCRTGQCIYPTWVLDGEWDCTDGSDEEGIYFPNNTFSHRNLHLFDRAKIDAEFGRRYPMQSFRTICDLRNEFPCFRINTSRPTADIHEGNRPCISLAKVGDRQIDCLGALDEQNTEDFCHRTTMLGRNFKCLSSDTCIPYMSICDKLCPHAADDRSLCPNQNPSPGCSEPGLDFLCFNGSCAKNGWCNEEPECAYGEDEYLCDDPRDSDKITKDAYHRQAKDVDFEYTKQSFHPLQFPDNLQKSQSRIASLSVPIARAADATADAKNVAYVCNRGVGVFAADGSVVCFCPQQYYGDRCQYHNDRLTFAFHMNFSQSVYTVSNDSNILLKVLVLFLFDNEVLSSYEFHARPLAELARYYKKIDHVVYPRSNQSLRHKRARYFNRSSVIDEQPYAVRIEAYEVAFEKKPDLVAVWQYPIYFDFLPSFRFAKVLHMIKPNNTENPCANSSCKGHQVCHPLTNDRSRYVCLCPEKYHGENCAQLNAVCTEGYCASGALCKPSYRGLLNRQELPYCVCSRKTYGFRCHLQQSQCDSSPCRNNGTCFEGSTPGSYFCVCEPTNQGKLCEEEKAIIRLHLNKTIEHQLAVVQYFQIDYHNLKLRLGHQHLYRQLPSFVIYRHMEASVTPEIISMRVYSGAQMQIHLIAVYIQAASFNVTTELTEHNRCRHVQTLFSIDEETSPFKYHRPCRERGDLLCFHDQDYLCICDRNHTRTDCFQYDHSLDRCSRCMAGGRCVRGDRRRPDDFFCICSPCHSGRFCQFSSESFSFTLDQLFSADLLSERPFVRHTATYLLIIGPALLFLGGFVNNGLAFATFRRPKCRRIGSGQYLLFMTVINQVNLGMLTVRLTHLTLNIIGVRAEPQANVILCSLFNYLLKATGRITYWLGSLIAIERAYTTVFLNKRWLKRPHIARRLIIVMTCGSLLTGAHELFFVSAHAGFNDGQSTICILSLPQSFSVWTHYHQGVTIINALLPFLINLCSVVTITYVVVRNKVLLNRKDTHENLSDFTASVVNHTARPVQTRKDRWRTRFALLREVLYENKEIVVGPAVTLVPQLFSLPLFIVSLTLVCETLETSSIRYLLIVSYFASYVPQLISFLLYISPSSLYSHEWRATELSKRLSILKPFRRSTQSTNHESLVLSTDKN